MIFGIYDTQDKVWLGDENGPKIFDEQDVQWKGEALKMAQLSARMTDVQMGWAAGRCRARPYNVANLRLKDEVKTKMGSEAALKALESGTVL